MEKIEEIKNNLSFEQQERQEKFVEISNMMLYVFESLKKNQDSKAADEAIERVQEITQKFIDNNLELRDFLLGKVLLSSKDVSFDLYSPFDTEDGEIEQLIKELYNQRIEKDAPNKKKQPK